MGQQICEVSATSQPWKNLNQLSKQNRVSTAWIPGHAEVHGNEVADYLAKSGSKSKIHGPKPFITVPHANCVSTSSVRRILKRGGGSNFRKFGKN